MEKKERLNELYLIRAMAIMGVVAIHSTSETIAHVAGTSWLEYYNFINRFFKFGTPTFIFLSSFVLFYSYYHRPITKDLMTRFYRNRLLYIVTPYLVFSAIFFVVNNHHNFPVDSLSYIAKHFAKLLLTGHAHEHLYFVIINIQYYILFPLLLLCFSRFKWARLTAIPMGFVLQWAFLYLNNRYFHVANKGSLCISWTSYYFLGVFCGIYYDRVKNWLVIKRTELVSLKGLAWFSLWAIWVLGAVLYVGLWYRTRVTGVWSHSLLYEAYYNLFTSCSAIVLFQLSFIIAKHFPRSMVRILYTIGSTSFGIYLFHPLVLRYYRMTLSLIDERYYHIWVCGGYIAALSLSAVAVWMVGRYTRFSWVFFGNQPSSVPQQRVEKLKKSDQSLAS